MFFRASFVFYVSCLSLTSTVFGADAVTLELIRATLKEHQTACMSLRVKYRDVLESQTIRTGAGPVSIPGHDGVDWEWLQDGRKQAIRASALKSPQPNSDLSPIWASFDGKFGYEVFYWDRTPVVKQIRQTRDRPMRLQHCTVLAAMGWQLGIDQEGLYRCLELPGARLEGLEEVEGAPCWKVRCDEITVHGVKGSGLIAWLDPEHGFLPRRWSIMPLRALSLPKGEPYHHKHQPGDQINGGAISAFQQVEDLATGEKRWFPKLIEKKRGLRGRAEVVDVAWNGSISTHEFVPQMVDGAEWVEVAVNGTEQRKYLGGERGREFYYERWRESNLAAGLPPPTMPNGSPPTPTLPADLQLADATPGLPWGSFWVRVALAVFGLICLSLAFWRWRSQ